MIDYAAVLEDLAEKRAAAVNLFDQVSAGLRLLVPSAPTEVARPRQLKAAPAPHLVAAKVQRTPARSAPKVQAAPAKVAKPARHSGKLNEAQLEQARTWWAQGVKVITIAKRLGVSDPAIYYQAKARGWPKPSGASNPAAKKLKGEKTPMRRCDSCQMTTERDPCNLCGTKWRANGS